jgi:hypothetical protein
MASITTILGTDSVSSSRIVLNNNFASLNQELSNIAALFNTTAQTLNLTGAVNAGTLAIGNLFKVEDILVTVNLPIDFNQDVNIKGGLVHSPTVITGIPTVYNNATYLLDSNDFQSEIFLSDAKNGPEITLIATNGALEVNQDNIYGVTDIVTINNGGSLTLRYIQEIPSFVVISSFNCNLVTD